jgi:hypothetical protein
MFASSGGAAATGSEVTVTVAPACSPDCGSQGEDCMLLPSTTTSSTTTLVRAAPSHQHPLSANFCNTIRSHMETELDFCWKDDDSIDDEEDEEQDVLVSLTQLYPHHRLFHMSPDASCHLLSITDYVCVFVTESMNECVSAGE